MLLMDRFEDELDVDKLVLDQVELDQSIIGHAEVKAGDLLSRKDLFNELVSRELLLPDDPKRHTMVKKVAILGQYWLSVNQAILLLSVPEEDYLEL